MTALEVAALFARIKALPLLLTVDGAHANTALFTAQHAQKDLFFCQETKDYDTVIEILSDYLKKNNN